MTSRSFRRPLTTLTLTAAVVASGFVGAGLFRDVQFARAEQRVQMAREQLESTQDLAAAFNAVNRAVAPSVVNITVQRTIRGVDMPREFRRFFDRDGLPDGMPDFPFRGDRDRGGGNNGRDDDGNPDGDGRGGGGIPQRGNGSGVIVEAADGKAWVLTNNHVARDADKFTITLHDGREVEDGRILGTDPKTDLAVIEVKVDNVIPAKLGDSDRMKVGDWVLAFGSPLGFAGSMTHGIVSASNRDGVGILGQAGYENFIQTDAPINPGNSGGPLVNIHGEVIGINTWIASSSGGSQGVGFAIPSNQAKPIYDALKSAGKVTRGWLGVEITDVRRARDEAKASGYDGETGVLVRRTWRGTPAAGILEPGDVVTTLNGNPVKTTRDLRNEVALMAPGTDAKLGIVRDGEARDVTVKLGEQPADVTAMGRGGDRDPSSPGGGGGGNAADALGLGLSDLTDRAREQYGLGDGADADGAVVTRVEPRSPAFAAGLRPGDVITRVGRTPVTTADDARRALEAAKDQGVRLMVTNRDGQRIVFIDPAVDGQE